MRFPTSFSARWVFLALVLYPAVLVGQQAIVLPRPETSGGRPLMQVLKERQTAREFGSQALSRQILSNLLWAAFGINRPESGKRTAPSAMNRQEIQIYIATAEGVYLFEPKAHALKPVLAEDLRAATGTQPFVKDAPVNLVYVADLAKADPDEEAVRYAFVDAGFIAQNVYLFCASERLATVVRGSVDRPALARAMKLAPNQKIILAQTVGYPK